MIRALEERDREVYIKMAHDFYHSPAVLHPIPDAHFVRTFEECMRSGAYSKGYILEAVGQTAGYALVSKSYSQEAGGFVYWLEELYIVDKFRSRGLGSEFLRYVEENKEKDVVRLRLEVEAENTKAVSLYKRLGYEVLDYVQMIKDESVKEEAASAHVSEAAVNSSEK